MFDGFKENREIGLLLIGLIEINLWYSFGACFLEMVFRLFHENQQLKVSLNCKLVLLDIYVFDGRKIVLFVKQ